ncbi:hypothetical protein [Virgisporangium ochraceum]|uniref:Uncharacterized protein n=1 Tax=Virgisporangium ochraceum TaxID=65505 RepID=A0A8J4EEE7_9ACTN|nr:hypothetical protein [Virgisporangium ochraceum]GIJ71651.1 hypothetical protein Voc01_065680 [Virgisporangium ochraceum]
MRDTASVVRPPRTRRDWPLWRLWVLVTTAGESVGFCVPALTGVLAARLDLPPAVGFPLMLAAGWVEGYVLGSAQQWVLRRRLRGLSGRAFAHATAGAAVVAYAIGMLPSTAGDLSRLPVAVVAVGATVGGLALLASIGTAQWLVLRRHGYGGPWWILTTAAAWLAGLGVFMVVATPLWQPGQPVVVTVLVGVLAGVLMAGTVAVLTGFAAQRLTREAIGNGVR